MSSPCGSTSKTITGRLRDARASMRSCYSGPCSRSVPSEVACFRSSPSGSSRAGGSRSPSPRALAVRSSTHPRSGTPATRYRRRSSAGPGGRQDDHRDDALGLLLILGELRGALGLLTAARLGPPGESRQGVCIAGGALGLLLDHSAKRTVAALE